MTDDQARAGERADSAPSGLTRRAALRRAGSGALWLAGAGTLLSACGDESGTGASTSSGAGASGGGPDIPLATKDRPVRLPTFPDIEAIPSGRSPEQGPLVIYDWADYLSPEVVKSFEQRYGVKVELTTFASMDEAVNKIHSGAIKADVWVPDSQRILQIAQAKLIQPINHSYIPNLANAIPAAADPWYDKGARYSTPNFINLYGVAWRNDLIDIDPASLDNPWDVYWTVPPDTSMGMVNADAYTAISMAMLRRGAKNLDRISEKDITAAMQDLQELKGLKLQYTAFQPLANGVEKLAYAYNGDMVQIAHYLPSKTPLKNVSWFFPEDGHGIILNDMWVIPRRAANPVLAHLFMDHFLELDSALANFRDVGYQTMLKNLTLEKLKDAKVADPYAIEMAFATPAHQENGIPVPITTSQQLIWFERAFRKLSSG